MGDCVRMCGRCGVWYASLTSISYTMSSPLSPVLLHHLTAPTMMSVWRVESWVIAKVMPDSTNSSRLSKGRRTFGIMSIAFRFERYTVAKIKVSSSHIPSVVSQNSQQAPTAHLSIQCYSYSTKKNLNDHIAHVRFFSHPSITLVIILFSSE